MSATPATPKNATLRAMVVEDDARYRSMLASMLRELQCETVLQASAAEALHALRTSQPDVIVLDLNMPRMDGLAFLKQARSAGCQSPVIILTGVGTLQAAQCAIQLGVSAFLTKPCHLGDLEVALERIRRAASADATPRDVDAWRESEVPPPVRCAPDSALTGATSGIETLAEMERRAILRALREHGGNRSAAAAALGISRRTMHYRLAEYRESGWSPPDNHDSSDSTTDARAT